ncbi:hypothetical protein M407DRAFT_24736 [Tulasnella calospora MUT 4182]|uniref:Uncharacterized protein n=1 Tax=Tulasnella calospora MUT 4182 TaxID=1051891 RepID=A0A0C3Q889_9AGAM|nr:hypothetical protein M407DRAFT_24736 [Tulasnella calospora MUT 4182]
MSHPFQGISVPLGALFQAHKRFVITNGQHGISREKFLEDLNLPKELEDVVNVQSTTEGFGGAGFVVTCPNEWIFNQVHEYTTRLDQGYSVSVRPALPTPRQGSIEGGSTEGAVTPASGSVSGPPTFDVPFSGSGFPSPWVVLHPLQTPAQESTESPFINHGYSDTLESWSSLSAHAGPSTIGPDSASQTSTGNDKEGGISDDDEEFFAVAEGEEEYAEEWGGGNGDTKENEEEEEAETFSSDASKGRSSPISYSNDEEEGSSAEDEKTRGSSDMDVDTTEDDEAETDGEEPLATGYEADHSEPDSDQDPHQLQQQPPYPWAFVSPSNRGEHYTQASVPVTFPTPTDNRAYRSASSTTDDLSNALPEPDNNNVSNHLSDEEDTGIDGLVHAISAMAMMFSGDDGTANPDVLPNGQCERDSPNTSAESAVLLRAIREEFDAILGVSPSTILGPDVHATVEDEQD